MVCEGPADYHYYTLLLKVIVCCLFTASRSIFPMEMQPGGKGERHPHHSVERDECLPLCNCLRNFFCLFALFFPSFCFTRFVCIHILHILPDAVVVPLSCPSTSPATSKSPNVLRVFFSFLFHTTRNHPCRRLSALLNPSCQLLCSPVASPSSCQCLTTLFCLTPFYPFQLSSSRIPFSFPFPRAFVFFPSFLFLFFLLFFSSSCPFSHPSTSLRPPHQKHTQPLSLPPLPSIRQQHPTDKQGNKTKELFQLKNHLIEL
ncbi:MAG: hypothetical protein JOS17DRAFT_438930 [Linnemannia elongata]|nr:MAG: hypothetical protein JOS17DRAFT_438930 [Linnemannia elongata]